MGQAKRKGSYEERKALAIDKLREDEEKFRSFIENATSEQKTLIGWRIKKWKERQVKKAALFALILPTYSYFTNRDLSTVTEHFWRELYLHTETQI